MGIVRKEKEKELAVLLRREGFTYPEIRERVNVSEATLSYWLRDVPVPELYFEKIKKKQIIARKTSAISVKKKWDKRYEDIKESYFPPYDDPFFMLGLGLYIGEGSKYNRSSVKLANSDAYVIRIFKKWVERYFWNDMFFWHIHIHTHVGKNETDIIKWWSKEIGINEKMFYKTLFEKRLGLKKTERKLEYGTAMITLCGSGMWMVAAKIDKAIKKLEP